METPDQYVHRAKQCDRAVAGTSADGSLNPMFPAQATGLPPRTLPSGRPLDRVWVHPQTPIRGHLPSRPPGERGDLPASNY
jgi:hypothetical protein